MTLANWLLITLTFEPTYVNARMLLQEELEDEDSRKLALEGLIEEIIARPDYTIEIKYWIGETIQLEQPLTLTSRDMLTAVQTPASAVYTYTSTWQYFPARV